MKTDYDVKKTIRDFARDPNNAARFHNYLSRFLPSPEDREEMIQETYVHALAALDYDREKAKLKTYLYTIARNLAFNLRRAANRALELTGEDLVISQEPSPLDRLISQEDTSRLREVLDDGTISGNQKACMILFYCCNLECLQIADILRIPNNTVKGHLHRGRISLSKSCLKRFKT